MARSKSRTEAATLVTTAVAITAAGWAPGTAVCVALSGGLDSMVLLHALVALRATQPAAWSLTAHHVHHGLSPNADAWAAHCESVCTGLSVPVTVDRVTVDRHAGTGTEAAARDVRLASLARVSADVVVFAHHARDQAETLLLQLLRGAGPAGMAAMPTTADRFVRPLLAVPKAALLQYAEQFALHWVEDESNLDDRFSRNRLRHDVWPALTAAFPAAEATLFRAAQLQAEASLLLDDLAQIDAATCVFDNSLRLPIFNELTNERRANLLRFWLHSNGIGAPAADTLREWLKQLGSSSAVQAIELRGVKQSSVIRVYRGHAFLVHDARPWQPCRWLGEASLQLKNNDLTVGHINFVPAVPNSQINAVPVLRAPQSNEMWLVRSRLDGDAIALSARSGHVALKNIFQQAQIPPWLRGTWPLLTCNGEIVSVVSIATAKAFTVATAEAGVRCEWKPAWSPTPGS